MQHRVDLPVKSKRLQTEAVKRFGNKCKGINLMVCSNVCSLLLFKPSCVCRSLTPKRLPLPLMNWFAPRLSFKLTQSRLEIPSFQNIIPAFRAVIVKRYCRSIWGERYVVEVLFSRKFELQFQTVANTTAILGKWEKNQYSLDCNPLHRTASILGNLCVCVCAAACFVILIFHWKLSKNPYF